MKKEYDPKFCEEYRAAREIDDLGGSHTPKNGETENAEAADEMSIAA